MIFLIKWASCLHHNGGSFYWGSDELIFSSKLRQVWTVVVCLLLRPIDLLLFAVIPIYFVVLF
jgi:hypothetical protein